MSIAPFIIFGLFAIMPFLFIFAVVAVIFFVLRSGSRQREVNTDETRMIQEMFHGLNQMAERAEALETILLDKMKKDEQA
jgi:phage shock protein B